LLIQSANLQWGGEKVKDETAKELLRRIFVRERPSVHEIVGMFIDREFGSPKGVAELRPDEWSLGDLSELEEEFGLIMEEEA
jgi:hypothetical protein